MSSARVIAIIPARGGSKGVPGKNIKLLGGHPLIAYSIIACKLCKMIERTIVSTDSDEIAAIARDYGAEVPFMRPKELAMDGSGDIEFVLHAIKWFKDNEGHVPEYFVHIRPTTPLRDPGIIAGAVTAILKNGEATSLRSAHELPEAPEKMFRIDRSGYLTGLFPDDPRPEYYNLPRQSFLPAYHPNGYVDIIKTSYVVKNDQLHGSRMIGFVTPKVTEVDTIEDFNYLEYQMDRQPCSLYKELSARPVKGG
ncbi:MAG: acylneuraminate cytidylyltransferase family protein [Candidatus Omnitrophota bacterium]|jgi:CMP-N-acetylneuraminic acid synthetase